MLKSTIYNLVLSKKNYEIKDSILLVGSSRSGTTWLGTTLASTKNFALLTEPLWPKYPDLANAGIQWRTYKEPNDYWISGKKIFNKILTGKYPPNHFYDNSIFQIATSKRLIIKCIRANRLLPWILKNYQLLKIVYLYRHPCAVVSSQLNRIDKSNNVMDYDKEYVYQNLPHLFPLINSLKHEEEFKAVSWCIDQLIPINISHNNLIPINYEKLVMNGIQELEKIYSLLDLELTNNVIKNFNQNSREKQSWSANHEKDSIEKRLSSWKKNLSKTQIDNILNVVEEFGVKNFNNLFNQHE